MQATQTTGDAMRVLKQHRASHIEAARAVADELIKLHGKTTTTRVREVMEGRGMIDPNVADHWLGAVFRAGRYRWTGEWADSFASERCHAPRPVKVWMAA
jgi:hypothetical protein